DNVFLAVGTAILRREQPDCVGACVNDRTWIAERIRPVVANDLNWAPRRATVMATPEDKIDVPGVPGAGTSPFGKREQCSLRRDDRRRDSIGMVGALACDEDLGQRGTSLVLLARRRRSDSGENE